MYPNLKAEIARAGLTQARLCEAAEIPFSTFTAKLRGISGFTLAEAIRIKKALGGKYTLEYLFEKREA